MPLLATLVVQYVVDASQLTAGATAAAEAVASVGAAADASSASLDTLGTSANAAVAGISGIDASLAGVAAASDASAVSVAAVDAELDSMAVSAGSAASFLDGLSISEGMMAASADIAKTSLAAIGASLAVVGVAAVAAGVVSTKMAGDFQQSMTQLETGAGEAHSNIQMVSDGILAMAPAVGTSTKDLSAGMYLIESAGQHGAQGLETLKDAAEGAKVGAASLADVANGVTTAMTDYASSGLTAAQATNDLIATTANGKTHMGELSRAMSTILPTSAAVGVSLTDTSAAMATMTSEGTSAASSATYLRQLLMALESPAKKGSDALRSIGLSSKQVSDEMKKSLPDALFMITDALGTKFPVGSAAYVSALKDISGGSKQMQGMLELTGDHLLTFSNNVSNISDTVKKGGSSVQGWSAVQGDFNTKMDQAKATLETVGINIGTKLLPVLGNLMADMSSPAFRQFAETVGVSIVNGIQGLINVITIVVGWITQFSNFLQHNQAAMVAFQITAIAVAGAIVAVLVVAFIAWAVAASAAAIATLAATWPILAIGALIALVVAGIVLAVQHWGDIVNWLKGVWSAFSGWFMGLLGGIGAWFTGLWKGLSAWFVGVWAGIIAFLHTAWDVIVTIFKIAGQVIFNVLFAPIIAIVALFEWLYNHNYYFKALVDAIVNFFKGCFEWCVNEWNGFIGWLGVLWQGIVNTAITVWNDIASAVKTGFFAAVGFVEWIWGLISEFFVNAWNNYISKPLAAVWTTVSTFFSNIWTNYIAGPIGSLWTSISTTIGGWATSAVTWGENLIQSFITGIGNKVGDIGTALSNTATKIASFLGFHSPTKEGPGMEADQWAPNFVKMYAKGLTDGIPLIEGAVSNFTKPISVGVKGVASTSGNTTLQGGGTQDNSVHIYLDGKEMSNQMMKRVVKDLRGHGLKK